MTCNLPSPGRQSVDLRRCTPLNAQRVVGVIVEGAADTTVAWVSYAGHRGRAGGAALAVPIP